MEADRKRTLRRAVLVLDALAIILALALAGGLQTALSDVVSIVKAPVAFETYAALVYLMVPVWLLGVRRLGLDRGFERIPGRFELIGGLIQLHVVGLVLLSVLLFITQIRINRTLVAAFLTSSMTLMYLERILTARWVRYQHRAGQGRTRILLVGDEGPELSAFVEASRREPLPPEIVGRLGQPGDGVEHLGPPDDMAQVLHDNAVDEVLFFAPYTHPDDCPTSLEACETVGVPARFAIDLARHFTAVPRLVSLYERPFVSFEVAPKAPASLAFKHALDAIAALVLILVFSPVLITAAICIAVSMGRPILFAQVRAGRNGRKFRMLKFRTMIDGADDMKDKLQDQNEMSGPVFKIEDDPRITPLGRLLRRTSIDELPQLFNVVGGSMSLVGPRPLPISEQQGIHGWQRRRLSMKPGITGLWQVSGRSNIDFEEWMKLDLRYVDDWSLAFDLEILLRTLPAVLAKSGAK